MSNYRTHQNLIAKAIPNLQKEFPNMRFFPRHVGLFYTRNGSPIQINTKGMFDYWALLQLDRFAIHVEFEFKTGDSKKSKEQKAWGKFLDGMKVPHFEIRENNLDEIKKSLKELIDSYQA